MPISKHSVTPEKGRPIHSVGVCAAGIINVLYSLMRARTPFVWRVEHAASVPNFQYTGLLSYMLSRNKVPRSLDWAIDAESITITYDGSEGDVLPALCFLWQVLRQPMERAYSGEYAAAESLWLRALEHPKINERKDDLWMHALACACWCTPAPAHPWMRERHGGMHNRGHAFRTHRNHTPHTMRDTVLRLVGARVYNSASYAEFATSLIFNRVKATAAVVEVVDTILNILREVQR